MTTKELYESVIPEDVKKKMAEHKPSPEGFGHFLAGYGWEDWMNEVLEYPESNELESEDSDTIDRIFGALWKEHLAERDDFQYKVFFAVRDCAWEWSHDEANSYKVPDEDINGLEEHDVLWEWAGDEEDGKDMRVRTTCPKIDLYRVVIDIQ